MPSISGSAWRTACSSEPAPRCDSTRWATTSVSVWVTKRWPEAARRALSGRWFSMIPLCTTTSRPWQSWWGWAFSSLGRPWVAQRVWPTPNAPRKGSARRLSSRFLSFPTDRRRWRRLSSTTAMPAESYPRYSSRRRPSMITGTASRAPT